MALVTALISDDISNNKAIANFFKFFKILFKNNKINNDGF